MKKIYLRTVGLITIFGTIFYGFSASPGDQVSEDLQHANPDIHWPTGFSPKTADLYTHNEIMIDAPVGVVFHHIQEAEKWPEWYANSQHVVIHDNDKLLQKDTEWEQNLCRHGRVCLWRRSERPSAKRSRCHAPWTRTLGYLPESFIGEEVTTATL